MAKPFQISMGLEDVVYKATRDIARYDTNTRQGIQNAIEKGTNDTAFEAIHLAPYGPTGNLKAGIKSEFKGGLYAHGKVTSTAPHSHLVEFGTGPRITTPKKAQALRLKNGDFVKGDIYSGRMSKAPFMKPAAEKVKPSIEAAVEEVLKRDNRA